MLKYYYGIALPAIFRGIILETENFSFYFKKIDELMRQLVRRIYIELRNNLVKRITGSGTCQAFCFKNHL